MPAYVRNNVLVSGESLKAMVLLRKDTKIHLWFSNWNLGFLLVNIGNFDKVMYVVYRKFG